MIYQVDIEYPCASLRLTIERENLDEVVETAESIAQNYEVWGVDRVPPISLVVKSAGRLILRMRAGEFLNAKVEPA